jgi:drug/metabolite transporter (DMT)-like permease
MNAEAQLERRATRPPFSGVLVAAVTAIISGVSVFANSYGVHSVSSPAVYTTAKNLVATLVLAGAAFGAARVRARRRGSMAANFVTGVSEGHVALGVGGWLGLAYVGVVGGGLAFVLFFEGLARSEAASAAFWRDTLVLWVALLAIAFLRERVRWWNVTAMALLIVGEVTLTGGVGHLGANTGELLIVGSSVLWAIEVVVARTLLRTMAPATLALVRMGVGALTLTCYLATTGALAQLGALDASQVRWVLWTGLLLGGYVATWMTALGRARALDVTSILVASALITWSLQWAAGTVSPAPAWLGIALIALGAGLVIVAGMSGGARGARRSASTS